MTLSCSLPKGVHVCNYVRVRNGRTEYVREHCRGFPSR
jgi:hypothetical protein